MTAPVIESFNSANFQKTRGVSSEVDDYQANAEFALAAHLCVRNEEVKNLVGKRFILHSVQYTLAL